MEAYFKENSVPESEDRIFKIEPRSVEGYFSLRAQKLLGVYEGRNRMSPHSVRKYFRKSIVNAGCPESYAEYWEGHDLNADLCKTYTAMAKEEWAAEYRKYMPALSFKILEPATK